MARYDFAAPRIYVSESLSFRQSIPLTREQAHYLANVLRLGNGDLVLAFNGQDGEWRCQFEGRKGQGTLLPLDCVRVQPTTLTGLQLCFAPLKHARLDYMVQKAVEMGAECLRPVITRRTQAARVNEERMRANAVEAAEQCGILTVPAVRASEKFDALMASWEPDRWMVFCDEDAEVADPIVALAELRGAVGVGVIVGPEGGFDQNERDALMALPRRLRISLGPRILRADTAAVAALALVGAVLDHAADR